MLGREGRKGILSGMSIDMEVFKIRVLRRVRSIILGRISERVGEYVD